MTGVQTCALPILRGRLVHDCCEATCVTPARDKAPVIEAMTGGGRWHELSSGEEMLPTPKHDATFIGGLRNVGCIGEV